MPASAFDSGFASSCAAWDFSSVFGSDTSDWKLSQISQKIGTVLQDPERQILGTKVLNEVAFGLENLGMPREEIFSRVDEALDFLKISHLLHI